MPNDVLGPYPSEAACSPPKGLFALACTVASDACFYLPIITAVSQPTSFGLCRRLPFPQLPQRYTYLYRNSEVLHMQSWSEVIIHTKCREPDPWLFC